MNEVVIKPFALREQFLGLGSVPRHFLQRAVRLRQVYSRHRLAQQSQNLRVFGRRPEFLHEPVPKKCRCDCDRFPARAQRPEDQQTLCAWIRENPELHFVILSRGVLPGWLMPFRFTGLLQLIEARDSAV